MIGLMLLSALGQTPTPQAAVPVVTAAPAAISSASPVPATVPPPAAAPRVAKPAPVRIKPTARIDQKKPFMRVWYWPPMPGGEVATTAQGSVMVTNAAHGASRPFGDVDSVNFPTNLASVVDEKAELSRLVQWMKANPGVSIYLDGYADSRGAQAKNLALSRKRVMAVSEFLVKAGVEEGRIATHAHGSGSPEKGQNLEETYWLSRRVTIRFQKLEEASPAPAPKPALAPKTGAEAVPAKESGTASGQPATGDAPVEIKGGA